MPFIPATTDVEPTILYSITVQIESYCASIPNLPCIGHIIAEFYVGGLGKADEGPRVDKRCGVEGVGRTRADGGEQGVDKRWMGAEQGRTRGKEQTGGGQGQTGVDQGRTKGEIGKGADQGVDEGGTQGGSHILSFGFGQIYGMAIHVGNRATAASDMAPHVCS